MTGGQYDVDVTLESPQKEILYRQIKTQFDSHQFVAPVILLFLLTIFHENYLIGKISSIANWNICSLF